MQVLRKSWSALWVLALLFFGAQGAASSICSDPAFITVLHGPGNTIETTVQSPDQEAWEGWVTMTFTVNGEDYTFSYPVSVPAGGTTRSHRLFFSGSPTLWEYRACADPDGMSESPEPVAIAESQN